MNERIVTPVPGRLIDRDSVMRFITAGNATVTVVDTRTDRRFTYKIRQPADPQRNWIRFVSVMTGGDNESNFTYIGNIWPDRGMLVYTHGRKSTIGRDAESHKMFTHFWNNVSLGNDFSEYEVWHEGRCGACGRKLTVPESIASGFGPECAEKGAF